MRLHLRRQASRAWPFLAIALTTIFMLHLGMMPVAAQEEVEPFRFAPGAISGVKSGPIPESGVKRYSLDAAQDQLMSVTIERERDRAGQETLSVSIIDPSGTEISAPGATAWCDLLPLSGRYQVAVYGKPNTAFTLTVTIVSQVSLVDASDDAADSSLRFEGTGQAIGQSVSNDVALGDVDGDGDLDAFVANGGTVEDKADKVWLNRGDGYFEESGQRLDNSDSRSVALGDVDGDGDLDAVVTHPAGVRLWLNRQGQFEPLADVLSTTLAAADDTVSALQVVLGDFNGDGRLDIVLANGGEQDAANEIWLNRGGVQFSQTVLAAADGIPPTYNSSSVAAADLDEDGCLDLAFVPDGVWLNTQNDAGDCSARFIYQADPLQLNWTTDRAEQTKARIALADFDNDGHVDAMIGANTAYFYKNAGDGQLGLVYPYRDAQSRLFDIAVGDVNFDGKIDAFTTHMGSSRNAILLNRSSGQGTDAFDFATLERYASNLGQAVALGDLNADGLLDAFVTGGMGGQVSSNQVLLNNLVPYRLTQNMELGQAVGIRSAAYKQIDGIVLAHLNDDTHLDALILGPNQVWTNYCNGHWGQDPALDFMGTQTIAAAATADLNNDGWTDVVLSKREGSDTLVDLFHGGADGFQPTQVLTDSTGVRGDTVVLGDVNGDGYPDLVVGNWCPETGCRADNHVYLNNGEGYLDHAGTVGSGASLSMALWDYDADNDLDLFVANYWNQPNKIYLNDGRGLFTDSHIDLGSFSSVDIAIADLDQDGAPDILETRYQMGLAVWWNDGGGRFQQEGLVWEPEERHDVDVADLNGDGLTDILLSNNSAHTLLTNRGQRRFDATQIAHAGSARRPNNAVGDLDHDGDLDLLLARRTGILHYTNLRQGVLSPPVAIQRPPAADPSGQFSASRLITDQVIPIPFTLCPQARSPDCPHPDSPAAVEAEYSLDGGGTWHPAQPAAHVDADPGSFQWDTFASGFFGQSTNVVVRLLRRPQPAVADPGTYAYPNQLAGPFQTPTSVAATSPFAVRGTQIRVCEQMGEANRAQLRADCASPSGTEAEGMGIANPVANAGVYALKDGSTTAGLMGDSITAFVSDANGYLSGRGPLAIGDGLFAARPMTEAYRIPPQLFFAAPAQPSSLDDGGSLRVDSLHTPLTETLSVEFWIYATGSHGTLFALADGAAESPTDAVVLAYAPLSDSALSDSAVSDTTMISVTVLGESLATTGIPLVDGRGHHLALTWVGGAADDNTVLYVDGRPVLTGTLAPGRSLPPVQTLTMGEGYQGTLDEIRLWRSLRSPGQIGQGLAVTDDPFVTSGVNLLTVHPEARADLAAYWPVERTDGQQIADLSGQGNHARLAGSVVVDYRSLFTLYHTSGRVAISDTVGLASTISDTTLLHNGLILDKVQSAGVQPLVVSAHNPLILFDLDVSLEWDARNDPIFLQELTDSFQRASAILYDVTNGQAGLGEINLFHDKAYWSAADIIILADNSLRPSAAIGGVVSGPVADPAISAQDGRSAYIPGQIRMGTVWDPYAQNTADLGEQWERALAHELAHYLFFLPDNYLGLKPLHGEACGEECAEGAEILRTVVCPDSFMTTTSDPGYTEFLTAAGWEKGDCPVTLAQKTTQRNDWQTITQFYPWLTPPARPPISGPADLPLAVTRVTPWAFVDAPLPYAARNFDVRDTDEARLRLPDARAYLFKTHDRDDPTDDTVIALGSPTGGGDWLKVRGAAPGDRLCLFDSGAQRSGCIDPINANTVAVVAPPLSAALPVWQPNILARAPGAFTVTLTVVQDLLPGETLMAQIFPMHYGSVPGNAPVAALAGNGVAHTGTLTMGWPAYEVAVRVWVDAPPGCANEADKFNCLREAVTILRLDPETWDVPASTWADDEERPVRWLEVSPILGGPDRPGLGGPDRPGLGGPDRPGLGGPDRPGLGGPDRPGLGGPDRPGLGGPDRPGLGGPDRPGLGGSDFSTHAPVLSADAQVVIYSVKGFFAKTDVESVQSLAGVPGQADNSWLVPVGQAYRVTVNPSDAARYISITYLQRDVPEGYEYALDLYFLADGETRWQPVAESTGFVENLAVGRLDERDGVYAVMAALQMPALQPGWNLLTYPLPITRTVTATLASIAGQYAAVREVGTITPTVTVLDGVGSLRVREGPGVDYATVSFLRGGESYPLLGQDGETGWRRIECPQAAVSATGCWISGSERYVRATETMPSTIQADGSFRVDTLQPNRSYWINVTAATPVDLRIAPPVRGPDGVLK